MRQFKPLILLAILAVALTLWNQHVGTPTISSGASSSSATSGNAGTTSLPAFLPSEAHTTLALIASGGPFPHSQDGVVFGNYEHLLPEQPRGYYHEYTVDTPGARTRGTRRIITGGSPPDTYYYTDDHYRSFRNFKVTQ